MALVIDTGPLIAALDADDEQHRSCARLLATTREQRVIPAPVLVEVDYWARTRLGTRAFLGLLDDIRRGAFAVDDLRTEDYDRIQEIYSTYGDLRVGFVDAAVLAVVERYGESKLATLDRRHFGVMRPRHVPSLQLLPDLPVRRRRR